jgi:membrane-bound serine protease (ClpP class)
MRLALRRVLATLALLVGVAAWAESTPEPVASTAAVPQVVLIEIAGSINPASANHIIQGIELAEREGAAAALIELDTPGGLVSSTKDIIQAMLNASVPVIVYVAPRGAWAGSAGTFITLAGHVAAMAPGTTIGAASPIGIGPSGGESEDDESKDVAMEKAENMMAAFIESIAKQRQRNVEWAVKAVREAVAVSDGEALELGVIDLVASTREELFEKIDGRSVDVAGEVRELRVAGAQVRETQMSWANQLLNVLATPDVAVLLILAGVFGLYTEFSNPGLIVPGVVGGVSLVLGLIALQILPFSWYGLLLFAVGLGLFAAELFVTSYGLLFLAGVGCLLLGGSMLFDVPEVGNLSVSFWSVLVPAVASLSLFALIVLVAVGRSFRRPQVSGAYELVGMVGTASTDLDREGTVFVRGEYWNARAAAPIKKGERVEVESVDGLMIRVRAALPAA